MRRWAIDIWANRVRTIFVDGGCVDQGVSKTALQQKGLRKCMHWYVSCLFCRRTKQHVSRCMLTRTELFDASFASAFRPWTRIGAFYFKTAAGSPKRPPKQGPKQTPKQASNETSGWGRLGGRLGGVSRALLGTLWTTLSGHISKYMGKLCFKNPEVGQIAFVRSVAQPRDRPTNEPIDRPSDRPTNDFPDVAQSTQTANKQTNKHTNK